MLTRSKSEEATKAMTPQQKQEASGAEPTRPGPMFTPSVDIFETAAAITVLADMPGVRPDGLSIDLRDSMLRIEGRVEPTPARSEQWLLQEYETGAYVREFRLTNLIDQEHINAALADGVLRLTLPKAAKARPRKIEVQAS